MILFPKRENLTLPVNGVIENWDYLSIYDKNNNLIIRSNHNHPEGTIRLEFDGLEYVSRPGEILVTWKSIFNKFN